VSVRVPASHCPDCGELCDAATHASSDGEVMPVEGDVTICMCGSILQFGPGLVLEPIDWSKVGESSLKMKLLRLQNMVLDMKGKGR